MIAFSLDVHGTAWKRLDPAELSLTAQLTIFKVKNSTLFQLFVIQFLPIVDGKVYTFILHFTCLMKHASCPNNLN